MVNCRIGARVGLVQNLKNLHNYVLTLSYTLHYRQVPYHEDAHCPLHLACSLVSFRTSRVPVCVRILSVQSLYRLMQGVAYITIILYIG